MTTGLDTADGRKHRLGHGIAVGWRWFRAFRRTRPFWGGLWMLLGGWTIMKFALVPIRLLTQFGFSGIAGYFLGGGLMCFGLVCWLVPAHRRIVGVLGVGFAIVSLVESNLGGFLLGMFLGVLGGCMAFGWGEKKPARRTRRRAEA